MKRRNGSGRFTQGAASGEDINPMDSVANLADVMLVFACGLMLALISFWNVDVAAATDHAPAAPQAQEITEEVSGLGGESGDALDEDGLMEYGRVYRDPATGKLYMVTDAERE